MGEAHNNTRTPPFLARRETIAGLAMVALSVAIVVAAFDLPIGTAQRMGAGFLPLALGILIGIAGAGIALGALTRAERMPAFNTWRPIAALAAAFVAFAAAIDPLGLVIAVLAAVVVASLAMPIRRVWESALYAAAMAAFAVALFVELLGLPMAVWP